MESLINQKSYKCKSVDRTFTVRELSGGQLLTFMESGKAEDSIKNAALLCSMAVVEWQGETPEEIVNNVTAKTLLELSDVILEMQGFENAKKSGRAKKDDSSTD